jgi:hypothetical protein
MEQSEVLRRVVGILTQTLELSRLSKGGATREAFDPGLEVLKDFVGEVMRSRIAVPGDASPQEIADAAAEDANRSATQLVYALAFAFVHLAEYHDAGRADVSSLEVLREIAAMANDPDAE